MGKEMRLSTLWFPKGWKMKATEPHLNTRSWWSSILSDIHFWVPVAVLIGGLLLLRFIR
jgi:hypothetical protein